VNKLEERR